jgi:hypothetical protein
MRDRAETTLFRTAMRTVAGLVAAFALLLQLSLASPLAIRALGIARDVVEQTPTLAIVDPSKPNCRWSLT